MSKKKLFLAITNGFWFIEPERAALFGPTIAKLLKGEKAYWDSSDDEEKESTIPCYSIDNAGAVEFAVKGESNIFNKAKPGSVAVINIEGPIMKHDNCGDPGTQTYESWVKQANLNPNISAIVLKIDSPGGTVDGTESLAKVISSAKEQKPVVTLVDNLMASAAYWIGSNSNHIMAANKTSQIGSIGTMVSFADMQPAWEKMGVKFHEIYADDSKDKNNAFAEARKGNYDKIKNEMLNPINNIFLAAVKENRAGKIDLKKENVLSGKVYLAEDAVKNGLIDSIGNLDEAIQKAADLATNQLTNSKPTNMKKLSTFAASLVAFLNLKGFKDSGEQTSLTEEQLIVVNSRIEELTNENTRLTSDLAASNSKVTEKEEALTASATKISELEAKVTEYGGQNAGATNTKKKGTDTIEEEASGEEEFLTSVDKERAALKKQGLI